MVLNEFKVALAGISCSLTGCDGENSSLWRPGQMLYVRLEFQPITFDNVKIVKKLVSNRLPVSHSSVDRYCTSVRLAKHLVLFCLST